MSPWLTFVLLVLASFRLTRLVVKDDFPPIAWLRERIRYARPIVWTRPPQTGGIAVGDPADPGEWRYWWLGELVSCHWCTSAYVSAGAVLCTDLVTGLPMPVLWALGVWGAAAVLADRLG